METRESRTELGRDSLHSLREAGKDLEGTFFRAGFKKWASKFSQGSKQGLFSF